MMSLKRRVFLLRGVLSAAVFLTSLTAMAQISIGGLADLELRWADDDAAPHINQTPKAGLSFYTPNLRLFFDGEISPNWGIIGAVQSDFYGRKDLSPMFFSLLAVQWQPFEDRNMTFSAGRLIIPVGSYSERFMSSEHPFRHLPFTHEWTLPIDKKIGFGLGPRSYETYPGTTMIYNRMYAQGISVEGFSGENAEFGYTLLWGMNSPSGFYDYAEHGMTGVMGRLTWRPAIAFRIGTSFGYGPYMKRMVENDMLSKKELASYRQYVLGADFEYSYKYVILRAEYMYTEWTAPWLAPTPPPSGIQFDLVPSNSHGTFWLREKEVRAGGQSIQGEIVYRLKSIPGLSLVGRIEYLIFSELTIAGGGYGTTRSNWFPDVYRTEAGLNYTLSRNVKSKLTWMHAVNDGNDLADDTIGLQISVGF
jgi:hypothetical protein